MLNIQIANTDMPSITALPLNKKIKAIREITPKIITKFPIILSDFFKEFPIKIREKGIVKKKIIPKKICIIKIVSGNIPRAIKDNTQTISNFVPMVSSIISLFLKPIAKIVPKIPLNINPRLNKIEDIPLEL